MFFHDAQDAIRLRFTKSSIDAGLVRDSVRMQSQKPVRATKGKADKNLTRCGYVPAEESPHGHTDSAIYFAAENRSGYRARPLIQLPVRPRPRHPTTALETQYDSLVVSAEDAIEVQVAGEQPVLRAKGLQALRSDSLGIPRPGDAASRSRF